MSQSVRKRMKVQVLVGEIVDPTTAAPDTAAPQD
jgi:hypothetical protein